MSVRCFTDTLATAQLSAPASARASATGGNSDPTVNAMSARPVKAMVMPAHCPTLGRSRGKIAAGNTVKNACICWVTEASPAGSPAL